MTDSSYPYLVEGAWAVPRGLVQRGPITKLDPDLPRVSIYCTGRQLKDAAPGETSHKEDPWFIASFIHRDFEESGFRWVIDRVYPTRDGTGFPVGEHAAGTLIGNRPAGDDPTAPYDPDFRVRYNLACKPCGLGRTRLSDELNADLDALWVNGVREISLASYMSFFAAR